VIPLAGIDEIGREAARRAAREELSDRRYTDAQPPLITRIVGRIIREFLELLAKAADGAPGGTLGLLLLAALVVLLAAVVFDKLGPPGRREATAPLFGTGRELSADEHRQLADEAAAQGRWADAVRERLRAVVRELEARGVVEPRPGRTADEVALEAGRVLPPLAEPLRAGARLFDEVWYGGRPADASSYAVLVALDERVVAVRVVPA
jgi:hypothetical protein